MTGAARQNVWGMAPNQVSRVRLLVRLRGRLATTTMRCPAAPNVFTDCTINRVNPRTDPSSLGCPAPPTIGSALEPEEGRRRRQGQRPGRGARRRPIPDDRHGLRLLHLETADGRLRDHPQPRSRSAPSSPKPCSASNEGSSMKRRDRGNRPGPGHLRGRPGDAAGDRGARHRPRVHVHDPARRAERRGRGAIAAARYIRTGTGGTAEPTKMRQAACFYAEQNGFFPGAGGNLSMAASRPTTRTARS